MSHGFNNDFSLLAKYQEMDGESKVKFVHDKLLTQISNMDEIIDEMLQRQEADFLSAYRVSSSPKLTACRGT